MHPDVSVLVVTYNSAAFIDDCLRAVEQNTDCAHEVIVVDNDSRDDTVAVVRERWPDVRVAALPANTGFAHANNTGAGMARGRHLLLLNGDAVVGPGAIDVLARFLDDNPSAGAVAPKLLNPDGTDQGTARRFPTPAAAVFGRRSLLTRIAPRNRWSRRYLAGREMSDRSAFAVDWVSGACLMTPAETYRAVGGLDEGFFMHWEDADYCRRLTGLGRRVFCVPTARVVHAEGGSRRGWPAAQVRHFHRGAYRYYAKHHLAAWPARAVRPAVGLLLALRAGLLIAHHEVLRGRQ